MVIRKTRNKKEWVLYSHKTHRVLGRFKSKGAAIKREEQVEYFKHIHGER